jgi:hypothetical protein
LRKVHTNVVVAQTKSALLGQALACGLLIRATETAHNEATITTCC